MGREILSRRMFLGLLGGATATGLGSLAIASAAGNTPNITVEPGCADGRFEKKEEDGEGPFQSLQITTHPDLDASKGTITTLSEKKGDKAISQVVRVTEPGEALHPMQIVSYPQPLEGFSDFGPVPQIRPNGENQVTVYQRAGTSSSLEKGPILAKADVVSPPCPPPPNPLTPSPR